MLATAGSEVSITKDLGTDGADVLAGNGVHKVIVIATILQVPAESTKYFNCIYVVLNPINIKFSNRIWVLVHGLGERNATVISRCTYAIDTGE